MVKNISLEKRANKMIRKTKHVAGLALALGLLSAGNAWGERAYIQANVERLLTITSGTFGGCMAQLDTSIASAGLDCRSNWITFSCTGEFASRQDAKINFEMVQLAFAMGKEIRVLADDDRKHNDYCFSNRVDVLQ